MWREELTERITGFLTRPQTRRQKHMSLFDRLEAGDVSAGALDQWDGQSSLCLCEDCYTLNLTEYRRCRRCAGQLRYHPRLQPSQIYAHLEEAREFAPEWRRRGRNRAADGAPDNAN